MKAIALGAVAGMLSLGVTAASAKTVTVPQKDNDRVVAGVSGAAPGKDKANVATTDSAMKPGKKNAKTPRVMTPPPMHDPN